MAKRREIRNSTAEFLIFLIEGKSQGVEVFYKDKTVWCTQKAMGTLFDCSTDNVGLHLKNIFASGELVKDSVTEKISATASDGKNYMTQFYNLDAIISVGYRVNSIRATQFRQWATSVLREFAIRGYVLDRKRMENGTFLDEDYFEHLLAEIREIRLSERRFYQKLTDIYATAIDYNRDAPTTRQFFQMMQNKTMVSTNRLHYAVHGHTAAELIMERADAEREHMGQLVTGVLELAERMAKRHIPMTMEDWAKQIDTILAAGRNEVLQNSGQVTAEEAMSDLDESEKEFERGDALTDEEFNTKCQALIDSFAV